MGHLRDQCCLPFFAPSVASDECFSKSRTADIWVDYLVVQGHRYGIRALAFSRLNTREVIVGESLWLVAETCAYIQALSVGGEGAIPDQEDQHREVTG